MHAYILYHGLAMPLILYAFIFFTLQGTPQTTITVNMTFISKSALDAEDSPPPIPPKLSLDDEFDDDPPCTSNSSKAIFRQFSSNTPHETA